jgi:4-hydroxybenzoate polyprenyltransferase
VVPRSAWALLRASHALPTVAVTAFSTALALRVGRRWGSASVAAAVLAGQLAVGWSNDYLDREGDRLVGRTEKPIVAGEVSAEAVGLGAVGAALACVPLSLLSGRRAAAVHVMAVGSALAYNAGLKRTVFSVVPYTVAFGVLPAFVSLGSDPRRLPPASAMGAAALMGAGAHFVNTLPDLDDDAATGVRGLPHRLGPRLSLVTGAALLGGAVAMVALTGSRPMGRSGTALTAAAGASVAGVVATALAGQERTAWSLSLGTAALTVGLYLVRGDSLAPKARPQARHG